jgi:uroporphyrin-III C-methyltransferase/precorrin-2 dehydrogenase/sirohydrochlorin ferrochelatase
VTAASACAAYAGIPLTHRDYAQSCVFTTGHRRGDGTLEIDFEGLIRPGQTIVFYMGLSGLAALTQGLIAHGMRPDMPAALVQQGTTENQRVVAGPLHALSALAEEVKLRAPTLIIVGEVVGLRERLAWFEPHGGGGSFWGD